MSDDSNVTGGAPPIPESIEFTNAWLDDVTDYGRDILAIRDGLFTTSAMADFWGIESAEASALRQDYRIRVGGIRRNRGSVLLEASDPRCLYVVAHEGAYGPGAPWRVLATAHTTGITEPVRRIYRLNQIRHICWEFYDHAKKEIVSFACENIAAVVMLDTGTRSVAAQEQRLAIRDYAHDLLLRLKRDAQQQTEWIMDRLNVPARQRGEYYKYFSNGFWPYVEVLVDEEVRRLTANL